MLRQKTKGQHTLRVRNAPGSDSVVKLKNSSGQTVIALYVHSGATASVASVPEGSFNLVYASGNGYSRACGYFLDDLSVSKTDTIASFRTTTRGRSTYTAINELTLTLVTEGNLHFQKASLDDFLDE